MKRPKNLFRKKSILLHGDAKQLLKMCPSGSIDLVVTSPPYDNLRYYNDQGPFTYNDFKIIANELKRVLKAGGVIVWVVGDQTINGSETGSSFKQALYFKKIGLNIHDTMIYQKGSFTYPMKNRYQQIFEYMFVFSQGTPKTFNAIKDWVNKCAGEKIRGRQRRPDGTLEKKSGSRSGKRINKFGMRTNIWRILNGYFKSTKDKIAYLHPAIFPEKLARDHIISWSNPGDTVLDPFTGSGTTGKICKYLKRRFIGIEMDKAYFEIAKQRINKDCAA